MINVYIQNYEDVSSELLELFRTYNSRDRGRMRLNLSKDYRLVSNRKIFYIKSKDGIKAWGMLYNCRGLRCPVADIYTLRKYRNKGYGSAIAEVMRSMVNSSIRCVHDLTSIYKRYGFNKKTNHE